MTTMCLCVCRLGCACGELRGWGHGEYSILTTDRIGATLIDERAGVRGCFESPRKYLRWYLSSSVIFLKSWPDNVDEGLSGDDEKHDSGESDVSTYWRTSA
jgi:hypothetical protein